MAKHPKNCHCCGGTGVEVDRVKQGLVLSGLRLRSGVSLRSMARHLEISHTYLWQMEKGLRKFPTDVEFAYRACCQYKTK